MISPIIFAARIFVADAFKRNSHNHRLQRERRGFVLLQTTETECFYFFSLEKKDDKAASRMQSSHGEC